MDGEVKQDIQVNELCIEKLKVLQQDPSTFAILDVLESWSLCGRTACVERMLNGIDVLAKFFLLVTGSLLIGTPILLYYIYQLRFRDAYGYDKLIENGKKRA